MIHGLHGHLPGLSAPESKPSSVDLHDERALAAVLEDHDFSSRGQTEGDQALG